MPHLKKLCDNELTEERGNNMRSIQAEPLALDFEPATTALIIFDMQRDFVMPGGFGEMLGNDTSLLLAAVERRAMTSFINYIPSAARR
jgi:hypothetical protein